MVSVPPEASKPELVDLVSVPLKASKSYLLDLVSVPKHSLKILIGGFGLGSSSRAQSPQW